MIERVVPKWREMLHPDDRWLGQVEALRVCAHVRCERRTLGDAAPTGAAVARLWEAESFLARERELFPSDSAGNALHKLVLRTLRDLYDPGALDDPERRGKIARRLAEFGVFETKQSGSRSPAAPRRAPRGAGAS